MFRVYNRLGQLVYNNTDPGRGWDGSFGGHKLDPGTFIWVAEATDYNDKKIKRQGTVILVRL